MAWERKMMRTVRVRNERRVGVLASLLTAVAGVNASVGSMDLITETAQSVVRKISILSRYPIDSIATLRRVYTPGVAEVCLKIADDPEWARLYTSVSHMVAI